jgi:pentatricopeptide repeat domain-containing protein 1
MADVKRIVASLPLEQQAGPAVAHVLPMLDAKHFCSLLKELAKENLAFRTWQLFEWVKALPENHEAHHLANSSTYTTMITLCGAWNQVKR